MAQIPAVQYARKRPGAGGMEADLLDAQPAEAVPVSAVVADGIKTARNSLRKCEKQDEAVPEEGLSRGSRQRRNQAAAGGTNSLLMGAGYCIIKILICLRLGVPSKIFIPTVS